METVQCTDSRLIHLVRLYCKHQRYFSLNYYENFKLFASWYLEIPREFGYELCPANGGLPWYRSNWELHELAKILKLSDKDMLGILEEVYDDY